MNTLLESTNYFSSFSREFDSMFQENCLVPILLQYVANGEQDSVEKILNIQPGLLLKRGAVTDGAGRTFHDVSSFQYALWALDAHMWVMMMNYLAQEEQAKVMKAQLFKQFEEVETRGLTYQLMGQDFKKKYFDFNPIINALEAYVEFFEIWTVEKKIHHWCTQVGGAQRWDGKNDGFPAHVWDEIFRIDRTFYPTPNFSTEEKLPRGDRKFYNFTVGKEQLFSKNLEELGIDFGIFRGRCEPAAGRGAGAVKWRVERDLEALTTLFKVRKDYDIPLLKQQLKTSL